MKRRAWIALLLVLGLTGAFVLFAHAFEGGPKQPIASVMRAYPQPTPMPTSTWSAGKWVWEAWPQYKYGIAAASATANTVGALADLPAYSMFGWGPNASVMRAASEEGIVYFPMFRVLGRGEGPTLTRCIPRTSDSLVVEVATKFPGALWLAFNEPDFGYHPTKTDGDSDGCFTVPQAELAYDQAAQVFKHYQDLIWNIDPSARFACCGEYGTPSYLQNVQDAYYARYGTSMPVSAVHFHVYRFPYSQDPYNVNTYISAYQAKYSMVQNDPDTANLPIIISEAIFLGEEEYRDDILPVLDPWMEYVKNRSEIKAILWWVDYTGGSQASMIATMLFTTSAFTSTTTIGDEWQAEHMSWR